MIKMILQASDRTYAEKLLMLRDKVRNFKPMDDQAQVWIERSEESLNPFPQRDSRHRGMNGLKLTNAFCFESRTD